MLAGFAVSVCRYSTLVLCYRSNLLPVSKPETETSELSQTGKVLGIFTDWFFCYF